MSCSNTVEETKQNKTNKTTKPYNNYTGSVGSTISFGLNHSISYADTVQHHEFL